MARIHVVKSAQKDQGKCIRCHKQIPKGSAYQWVKASRFSPKYKKHTTCAPFTAMEMESNEKKGMCYQAQADLQLAIQDWNKDPDKISKNKRQPLEDMETAFEEAIGQVEEAIGEWETSYDNLPEGFQQGDSGQQMEELKGQAESYKDELEDFKDCAEEWDEEDGVTWAEWVEATREEADSAAGALEF